MKSRLIIQCLVVTALCAGIACAGVTPGVPATPLAKVCSGSVEFSIGPNGETVIDFAARPDLYRDTTYADGVANLGVASGAFVGNYTEAEIVAVKFKIAGDGHVPGDLAVVLYSGSRTWASRKLTKPTEAGVWVENTVGFNCTADEWRYALPRGADKQAEFLKALADVDALGIRLQPEYSNDAQEFMIKDFILVDANGVETPGDLTPLALMLRNRFGVTRIADVPAGDKDKDGMSDLDEALVGTDDNDPADTFVAEVLDTTDDGVLISWASAVEWASYDVYRATDLASGFTLVGDGLVLADVTVVEGDSQWVDTTADPDGGPYFYKVVSVIEEE